MKTFTSYDLKDAQIFMENKDYKQANELLNEMYDYSKNFLHIESGYLMYYIGYCHDCLGDSYAAIEWINGAIRIDPFNYDYAAYRSGALGEIEKTLEKHIPYGSAKLAEVIKIYNFLLDQGNVKSSLQFSMIRFYFKINDIVTAKKMLINFLERNPNDEEAKMMFASLDTFVVKNNPLKQKQNLKSA
jgi:tetratricopeptide (TPR) repeat protein